MLSPTQATQRKESVRSNQDSDILIIRTPQTDNAVAFKNKYVRSSRPKTSKVNKNRLMVSIDKT